MAWDGSDWGDYDLHNTQPGQSVMDKKKREESPEVVQAVKGFDKDWTCRGFRFEVGQEYRHDGIVKLCNSGFHACTYPLDVFGYYAPADSKYAGVTLHEPVVNNDGDSKIASAHITINDEIKLPEIVRRSVEWILSRIEPGKPLGEDRSRATNTGNQSAATNTGDQSAATNTGSWSAATNTGHRSAATNTGSWSAATNTGDRSAATNTGSWSAAIVAGGGSVAIAIGHDGKAKAGEGSAIVLCRRDDEGSLLSIRCSKVGENGIKPDTFYTLNEQDEFVEADQ